MRISESIPVNLSSKLSSLTETTVAWEPPQLFNMSAISDQQNVESLIEDGTVTRVIDRIALVADDLFEIKHPSEVENDDLRAEFVHSITAQGYEYGTWALFPWDGSLVHYSPKDEHQMLRTARNRPLITDAEQAQLLDARIVTLGLSVGSNVVRQVVRGGIGGYSTIADFDTISPSNTNRMEADARFTGDTKIDHVAKSISGLDPFITQILLREGFDGAALRSQNNSPDIIFEEVDDLQAKLKAREFAAENGVPLIMVTDIGDTSLVDVERYDTENPEPFLGRLSDKQVQALNDDMLSPNQKQQMMIKLVGIRNITPRLLQAAMGIGKTLSGLPQLGSTANMGGSLATVAAREILLGRDLPSGRYAAKTKGALGLRSPDKIDANMRTVRQFLTSQAKRT